MEPLRKLDVTLPLKEDLDEEFQQHVLQLVCQVRPKWTPSDLKAEVSVVELTLAIRFLITERKHGKSN